MLDFHKRGRYSTSVLVQETGMAERTMREAKEKVRLGEWGCQGVMDCAKYSTGVNITDLSGIVPRLVSIDLVSALRTVVPPPDSASPATEHLQNVGGPFGK